MKFKVLCFNDARVMRDPDPTRSSIQLAMADGVSASSSSEDERERSGSPPRPKNTKKVNRLFVWLPKRLKATPRGSHWDKLNRDGSVKEIEVDAGQRERRLRERMVENFLALATADLSR